MSGLIEQLEAIRERQGLPPLSDPRVIDGPPEPWPTERLDENPDAEDEFEPALPADSPLIPRFTPPQPVPAPPPVVPTVDPLELVVVGRAASYLGRAVELSDAEKAKIGAVVLTAIRRSVQAQLDEVAALLPRRKRRATGVATARPGDNKSGTSAGFESPVELAGSSPAPAGKRRGRPPKQRLDGRVS